MCGVVSFVLFIGIMWCEVVRLWDGWSEAVIIGVVWCESFILGVILGVLWCSVVLGVAVLLASVWCEGAFSDIVLEEVELSNAGL